jgi:DNA polymerase-3 subunit alpha
MLGLYVSDHPLRGLEMLLAKQASATIEEVTNLEGPWGGEIATITGLLTAVEHRTAKSGNLYGMVTIEDFTGEMQVLFMGKSYSEFGHLLVADTIVGLRGKLNARDDGMSMHAYGVSPIDIGARELGSPLMISVTDSRATEQLMGELKETLRRHRGENEVRLRLQTTSAIRIFALPFPVRVSPDLYGELKGLLGSQCLSD